MAGRAKFYVGHIHAGHLYYDITLGVFSSFDKAQAEALAKPRGLQRVIIETRELRRAGTVYGASEVLRSVIDRKVLKR